MKSLFLQIVILLILGGISSSCLATDRRSATLDDLDLRGSDCILIRTVRDYTPLDDRNLLIWGPAKRGYYVSLFRPVFGMRSSLRLGFSSRDDRLCPYGGDSVVFGGLNTEKVRISSISRVNAEQAAEILVRYGKKEPPRQKDPAPADVKGAEVEELG
ncbi:MAG: DUF6491 family protein [Woeseiaceae bacterium]|nr:DUF6491 family protein [Woeseiaceae bacterium]